MTFFVDRGIQQSSHDAAKEIDGELAPDAPVTIAVENLLRDVFEEGIRGGEIDERVALIVGYEFRAALNEMRAVVIE